MKAYKQKTRPENSPYEQGDINLPKQFLDKVKGQARAANDDLWEQLIGSTAANDNQNNEKTQPLQTREKAKNEINPASLGGTIFELRSQLLGDIIPTSSEKMSRRDREPGIDYFGEHARSIIRSGERLSQRETGEVSKEIQQIKVELKKLISSTKSLQAEFGHVTVETAPSDPGQYYVNFFEWMLIMIRQSRRKVEDSKAWLDAVQGKSKKMGYWGKAKKLGTTFTQANERNVATSTG